MSGAGEQGASGAGRPLVIGHRGASGRLPENTLAAFRGAFEDGADGVELDVRLSADGVPVVVHDASLFRTTGVRGRVRDRTAAELAECLARRARVGAAPGAGETGVPTLERALELAAGYGAVVWAELKGGEAALGEAVAALLGRRGWRDRVVVLSFDHEALRRIRRIDARVRTAATLAPSIRTPRLGPSRVVEAVERAGAASAALHVALATRRRVDALRERGLGVAVWTVNSRAIARRLDRFGVDAIMTDFPARLAGRTEAGR